jgi:hypothetical protein
MLVVLITLTPGRRNEFIDCHHAKVQVAVLSIMDVKIWWPCTQELLERAYRLREFTCEWFKNPKHSEYWPLFTTQDECTIVKYVMEVLRPFQYWTLWISKGHQVTLHHVITGSNGKFDHMDGIMRALAKKKTKWKEDLYFAVKCVRQKLSKCYFKVTPTTGLLHISAHVLNPFWKLPSFRKWEKGMDINSDDEGSYTTQYQEAFLKYVENEHCAKHLRLSGNKPKRDVTNNPFNRTASGSGQSSFDPYDLSSDDDEYLMPNNVAEMTPGCSDHAARLLTATRLYLNPLPEAPKNWVQINPNRNDYHSDPIAISSTFWLPPITDWWDQQEETHSKYAGLSNVLGVFPKQR